MYSLPWQDYAVMASFIAVSLGIGVYHGFMSRKHKTTTDFLSGDRKLKIIPTMISLMVSFISAIMVLGYVAELVAYGWALILGFCVSVVIAILLVVLLVIPVVYPLQLTSIYQYLDYRYDSKILRSMTTFLGVLGAVMYMSLAMFAPCKALQYVSGTPLSYTVPLMSIVCVIYTSIGGIKAVIWTDVFQFVMMFVGILVIIVKGTYDEGFVNIFSTAYEYGRIGQLRWTLDPRERQTVWTFLIGSVAYWASAFGISQAAVQRYCATPSIRAAKRVVLLNIPLMLLVSLSIGYCGCIVFAHNIRMQCDPMASGHISSYNMLLPVYVKKIFSDYKGFTGIFMAMLYGGALSSISSSLSGVAANTWIDLVKPYTKKHSERNETIFTQCIVVVYGLIAVIFVFILDTLQGTIIQLTSQILGSIVSPIFGLFVMAMVFRKSEYIGAISGIIVGFSFIAFVCVTSMGYRDFTPSLPGTSIQGCSDDWVTSSNATAAVVLLPIASGIENIFAISYMWYLVLGAIVTNVVGLGVSTVVRCISKEEETKQLPDGLFINFRNLLPWRPDQVTDCKTPQVDLNTFSNQK